MIACSLVSDGPSDAALLPMIRWAVEQHAGRCSVAAVWADLRRLARKPRNLAEKIGEAARLYPCDILFVHRDAERQPPDWRRAEIDTAVAEAQQDGMHVPHVCVVPVRMQEAWLLVDAAAIRRAAGNPNGRVPLTMPGGASIESVDAKRVLYDLLRAASELRGRRLQSFRPEICARRVSENIRDMRALTALPAFQRFESDVNDVLARLHLERQNG
jgi:hypothetical protein